ncbi:NAD-dependent epimerase/dehydratase family protein [Celerinatantimonas sp. YJH-8]|uniref:NAD-dependent epimerase/dehydratase family protein n=1 Tax=Celerinatantimonas sp. YJH-8 TaxID=3228714 RepID=UPI0038C4713E
MTSIVITGVTGFLGSHLARYFITEKYDVYGIKREHSSLDKLKDISSSINFINIDKDSLPEQLAAIKPAAIFHTACSYGRKNEKPSSILETNLIFSLQILEAAIDAEVECFINADSALAHDVSDYALSKFQFKQWGICLKDNIQFINLRIEHMYGVGDDDYKFVKWFVNQLHQQSEVIPLTTGEQQRDFIYIEDVVAAFATAFNKRNELGAFVELDVATGVAIPVKQFLQEIVTQYSSMFSLPKSILQFGAIPYRKNDAMSPGIDPGQMKSLGWQPKVSHKEGIIRMLESLK